MAARIPQTNQRPVSSLTDQSQFRTLDADGQREVLVTWPAVSGQTIEMSVVTRILDSDWSVAAITDSHWSIMTHDWYSAFLADTLHTNLRRDTSFSISGCLSWSIFRVDFKVNVCSILTLRWDLISGPASCWWQAEHFEEMRINSLGSIFVAHFVLRGDNIPWKL